MFLKRIKEVFTGAMKEHDVDRLRMLRVLKAAIEKAAIAARTSVKQALDDSDVEAVVRQEIKKLKDALVDFTRAARNDLAGAAKAEIEVLSSYIPKGLDPAELKAIVLEVVAKLKAEGVVEFGRVMGRVMKEVKGRADGETVAEAVREALHEEEKSS